MPKKRKSNARQAKEMREKEQREISGGASAKGSRKRKDESQQGHNTGSWIVG